MLKCRNWLCDYGKMMMRRLALFFALSAACTPDPGPKVASPESCPEGRQRVDEVCISNKVVDMVYCAEKLDCEEKLETFAEKLAGSAGANVAKVDLALKLSREQLTTYFQKCTKTGSKADAVAEVIEKCGQAAINEASPPPGVVAKAYPPGTRFKVECVQDTVSSDLRPVQATDTQICKDSLRGNVPPEPYEATANDAEYDRLYWRQDNGRRLFDCMCFRPPE